MKDMIYGQRKECEGFSLVKGSYKSDRKNRPKFKYKKIILLKYNKEIIINNLKNFCQENNLYIANFIHIIKGRGKSYNGYTIKKVIYHKEYIKYFQDNNLPILV